MVMHQDYNIPSSSMLEHMSHLDCNKFGFLVAVCRPYWDRWSSRRKQWAVKCQGEVRVKQEKDGNFVLPDTLAAVVCQGLHYGL
jgi:hypothetical protein